MEILEAVNVTTVALSKDAYCKFEDSPDPQWEAVIHTIKGKKGDPVVLRQSMLDVELLDPEPPPPGPPWDLKKCHTTSFPYQTHHLIPKALLPDHEVCVWLTDSPKNNPTEYQLKADTNYSIDHWRNGMFMPFVSNMRQWQKAGDESTKELVAFEVMRRAKIQLHQGSHSAEDFLELEDVETAGYNTMVEKLLLLVSVRTLNHVETCDECKAEGKKKVRPLLSLVRHTHMVSARLENLLSSWRIFVSKRAAHYFARYRDKKKNVRHQPDPLI